MKGLNITLIIVLLGWLGGCASQEKVPQPKPAQVESTARQASLESPVPAAEEPKADSPRKNPESLGGYMAAMASGLVERIPAEEPWMIVVTVKGNDSSSERFEKAVANSLVNQLQSLSREDQCFMVTTPEIRNRILEEQAETLKDTFDTDSGAEIGNLVRANAVLHAPLEVGSGHVVVTLQLIASETSAVLFSCMEEIPDQYLPKVEVLDPEILYSSYKSGRHAIRTLSPPANTAELAVSLDRTQVREGQTYNIEVKTRASGYLYLFVLQTDGTLAVLFPNQIPLESLQGGFMDNYLPANGRFSTRGSFELMASITGEETVLAILTENRLDTSPWGKVYTELGEAYPDYFWYTFGRNGTIRDSLKALKVQLEERKTGYWCADWKSFSIVR